VSSLQLANLPNLRDYGKAPFTLALVLILIALVVRPWRRRDVLLLSLGYGLLMGIGYGFRTDLLVDIPPFFITVALFLPDGVVRNVGVKVSAVLLFAGALSPQDGRSFRRCFSGDASNTTLLGLTTPFNDAPGVTGGRMDGDISQR
jgi:hypothetical protein